MKLNADKCNLLIAGNRHEYIYAKIGDACIGESKEQRLLGVTIDNKLKFENHILGLVKMAHNKLSALIRYSGILNFAKEGHL